MPPGVAQPGVQPDVPGKRFVPSPAAVAARRLTGTLGLTVTSCMRTLVTFPTSRQSSPPLHPAVAKSLPPARFVVTFNPAPTLGSAGVGVARRCLHSSTCTASPATSRIERCAWRARRARVLPPLRPAPPGSRPRQVAPVRVCRRRHAALWCGVMKLRSGFCLLPPGVAQPGVQPDVPWAALRAGPRPAG